MMILPESQPIRKQAAEALNPLVGQFAYLLFALGVIGTVALAIPVLGTCLGIYLCRNV